MNWKLISQLSMFGLAMGLATVFFIPSTIEPAIWLVIFLVCAYLIARQCQSKHFLHGLLLGLANSVWITTAHALFYPQYIAAHPREAEMMIAMPWPDRPRLMMMLTGPIIGSISGTVIGMFAVVAGRLLKRNPLFGR